MLAVIEMILRCHEKAEKNSYCRCCSAGAGGSAAGEALGAFTRDAIAASGPCLDALVKKSAAKRKRKASLAKAAARSAREPKAARPAKKAASSGREPKAARKTAESKPKAAAQESELLAKPAPGASLAVIGAFSCLCFRFVSCYT
jgi:hypothetical protein